MMIVVVMLIYTVSLKFQSPTSVIIHNQCLNIELISPVYFGNGVVCPKLSDQQIDINTEMKIRFEINTTQDEFEGSLLYKLHRNLHDQYSMDTSTTEDYNNEAKYVYMLVAWKMKDSKLFAYVALVEHTKEFIWNEDKLRKLYDKNHDLLEKYDDTISGTWFMNDNMTLKTVSKVSGSKGNFELSISISEDKKTGYAIRPLCIDLER
jgi:hypothetical protein